MKKITKLGIYLLIFSYLPFVFLAIFAGTTQSHFLKGTVLVLSVSAFIVGSVCMLDTFHSEKLVKTYLETKEELDENIKAYREATNRLQTYVLKHEGQLKETRVYIVETHNYEYDASPDTWDDETFMNEAEIQGNVFTLKSFEERWKNGNDFFMFAFLRIRKI